MADASRLEEVPSLVGSEKRAMRWSSQSKPIVALSEGLLGEKWKRGNRRLSKSLGFSL
jgi:hypothetical protein